MYSLDFFLLGAFGEQYKAANEVPERDSPRTPAARCVQPFRDGNGHSVTQDILGERRAAQKLRPTS